MAETLTKDRLFLLKPGFYDAGRGPYVCSACTQVEGYLALFPHVRQALDVVHVDFARPRQPIVDLLGEAHQGTPMLVVAQSRQVPTGARADTANGLQFVEGAGAILTYLALTYRAPQPQPT